MTTKLICFFTEHDFVYRCKVNFFSMNRAYGYAYHKTQRLIQLPSHSEVIRHIKHDDSSLYRSFNRQFSEFRFGVIVIHVLYYIIF